MNKDIYYDISLKSIKGLYQSVTIVFFGFVVGILLIRFVLGILGLISNNNSIFTQIVNTISYIFYIPFKGTLELSISSNHILDMVIIYAIFVYITLAIFILNFLNRFFRDFSFLSVISALLNFSFSMFIFLLLMNIGSLYIKTGSSFFTGILSLIFSLLIQPLISLSQGDIKPITGIIILLILGSMIWIFLYSIIEMLIQKNSIQQYQVRYKNKPETYKQKNIPVDIPLSTSFTKSFDKNIMVKDEQSTLSHKSEKPQSSSYKSLPLTPGLTQKKQPKLEQEYKREELPKSPFSSPSRLQPKTLLNQKIDLSTLKNKYRQSDSIFTFKTGINPKTPTKKSPLS